MEPYLFKIQATVFAINQLMNTPGINLGGTEMHNLKLELLKELTYRKNILKFPIDKRPNLEETNRYLEKLHIDFMDHYGTKLRFIEYAIIKLLKESDYEPSEINVVKVLKEVINERIKWEDIKKLPKAQRPLPDVQRRGQINRWFVQYYKGRFTEVPLKRGE